MNENVVNVPLSKAQLDYLCEFVDNDILEIYECYGDEAPETPFLENLYYLLETYRQCAELNKSAQS